MDIRPPVDISAAVSASSSSSSSSSSLLSSSMSASSAVGIQAPSPRHAMAESAAVDAMGPLGLGGCGFNSSRSDDTMGSDAGTDSGIRGGAKDNERLRRPSPSDSVNKMEEDNSAEDVTNLSKKRSDKNSREQMRYRKILYLIDNIRDKLESVGVLTGKESKTEVISAAGAYINQMKRQCETYTDLRAFSNDFYGGLFQCAPYAMALATQSGRLIEANSIFMNYFNVTVKPISPQESIFNLIHPSELPEFYVKLGHLMKNVRESKHKFIRIPLMCSGNSSDLSSNLVVSIVESSNPEVYLLLSILSPDDLAVLSLL